MGKHSSESEDILKEGAFNKMNTLMEGEEISRRQQYFGNEGIFIKEGHLEQEGHVI